ncbi:nicotinate-nucleotide diphosphorylase (carboxylating) [Exophiala xenobiotica]|nr:nicotinate-nucleotide diphosphorylase (carboxylating) [Exophiala xenobiotica]
MASHSDHADTSCLLPTALPDIVKAWLAEDAPTFDYGGFVVGDVHKTATLFQKTAGSIAGAPFVDEIFKQLGCTVSWLVKEGEFTDPQGDKVKVATVTGPVRKILLGERVSLNLLARCSGIATASRHLLEVMRQAGYNGVLAGTRKTTPGFRLAEKYGMLVARVDPHRMDLSSSILLKDNHIWSHGSITEAVRSARTVGGFTFKIEVEVASEEAADEAIEAGADIIMLDNFEGLQLRMAARNLKQKWRGKKPFLIECSGGLTLSNVADYLNNDVDVFSTSSIHQGCRHIDFSLKIDL